MGPYFPVSSYASLFFARIWGFEKIAPSTSLYRLASYGERPSPISLARDSEPLKSSLGVPSLSLCIREFSSFIFLPLPSVCPPGSLALQPAAGLSSVLSGPQHTQWANQVSQKPVPRAASQTARTLGTCSTLPSPSRRTRPEFGAYHQVH